jgi:Serine carboxypeptidase
MLCAVRCTRHHAVHHTHTHTHHALAGDARTAADARLFLLHWLQRFPSYASRPLYLAGESYGDCVTLYVTFGTLCMCAVPA